MEDRTSIFASNPAPLVLAFVLSTVMVAFKRSPWCPDWLLPFIAFALGAFGYSALAGFTARNFIVGVLIGGSAVGMNQAYRQSVNRVKGGPETDETREFKRRLNDVLAKTDGKLTIKTTKETTP